MIYKQQTSPQLELFTAMNFVVVDPQLEHLSSIATRHIDDATTMQRFAMLHPDTVFSRLDLCNIRSKEAQQWDLCGVESMVTPKRLATFRLSMKCVGCECVGNAFLVERHKNDNQYQYLNLYCIDNKQIMLMTVDHILPDSMGGRYDPLNFQTMCRSCNMEKKNLMSIDEIAAVRNNPTAYAKEWVHLPFLNAMLDLQLLIQTTTGEYRRTLQRVFDQYRRKNKVTTRQPELEKTTVALEKDIADTIANFEERPCMNVTRAKALGYIKGFWNANMKPLFARAVVGLARGRQVLYQALGGAKSQM